MGRHRFLISGPNQSRSGWIRKRCERGGGKGHTAPLAKLGKGSARAMASPSCASSTLPWTSASSSRPSAERRLTASRRAPSLVIVAQGKVKKYRQVGPAPQTRPCIPPCFSLPPITLLITCAYGIFHSMPFRAVDRFVPLALCQSIGILTFRVFFCSSFVLISFLPSVSACGLRRA